MVGCSYFFEIAFWKFVGDPQLNVTKSVYLIDAEHFSTLNLLWLEYRNTLYMSVKPGISSFEWYHQKCVDCMFVPLFHAKRSPNPIVKTALLQTTSTKSTSREWGVYGSVHKWRHHKFGVFRPPPSSLPYPLDDVIFYQPSLPPF